MSVYALVEMGTMPIGNAFTGVVIDQFGAEMGFFVGGALLIALIAGILVSQRSVMRQGVVGA